MNLAPQLPSKCCLASATDLDLPACYSIRRATKAADYESFSHLARAYHRELPVDLGFQVSCAGTLLMGSSPSNHPSPNALVYSLEPSGLSLLLTSLPSWLRPTCLLSGHRQGTCLPPRLLQQPCWHHSAAVTPAPLKSAAAAAVLASIMICRH